jgi:hypothetical protein
MNVKTVLKLWLLFSFLSACAIETVDNVSQATSSALVSPTQVLESELKTIPTATSIIALETPQATIPPTLVPVPSQTVTQTSVHWASIPKLSEVILSKQDFENINSWYAQYPLHIVDAKEEIGSSCLWDCAKFHYSNQERHWTILLLRAGDPQKAFTTVQKLKSNFAFFEEYTPDVLSGMLPGSWIVVHKAADEYFTSVTTGLSYGNIVVLITDSAKTCFDSADGFICEGDLYSLAAEVSELAKAQVQKLAEAGYPK